MNRCACSPMALATCGCACPVELTAIPAAKSRYSSPSVVVTQQPLPLATCSGVTENHTLDRCDVMPAMLCERSSQHVRVGVGEMERHRVAHFLGHIVEIGPVALRKNHLGETGTMCGEHLLLQPAD